jgi:DNA-binding transcriptional LysR family regulator
MDYSGWKLFVDTAEHGSLSKVAAAYGSSQPQISRRLAELEASCGSRLFLRTGRGVALTEFGQRILPDVRAWLASTDQLVNDIRASAGTPIGKVRIGSLPSTAHPLLSTLQRRLKAEHPQIQLAIREGQGAQLDTWLDDGSVDLAILFRTAPQPQNGDVYLVETSTYLVSAAGDPLTEKPTVRFAKLDKLPLVLFCRPNAWRNHLEAIASARGVTLNVQVEADSLSLQTHLAAQREAYALLGPYAIANAPKALRLKAAKLVDPVVTRHIALAMSRHATMTLACRTVMGIIREIAKAGVVGVR